MFSYQYRGGVTSAGDYTDWENGTNDSKLCIYVMLYSETCLQRSRKGPIIFFRCRQVAFHTSIWTLSPLNCKRFPLNLGFRYVQVPFKSGFTALLVTITKYLPPFIKEYYGANSRCQVVKHYTNTKRNFWSLVYRAQPNKTWCIPTKAITLHTKQKGQE